MKFEIPDAFLEGVKKGSVITFEQVRPFVPDSAGDREPWKILLSFQRTLEAMFRRAGVVLTIKSADSGS